MRQPPTRSEVIRAVNELVLRFSFMDVVLGPEDSQSFLAAFERELTSYIPTLREYLAAHEAELPLSAKLAYRERHPRPRITFAMGSRRTGRLLPSA